MSRAAMSPPYFCLLAHSKCSDRQEIQKLTRSSVIARMDASEKPVLAAR
jgi:hypothetical protein